MSKINELFNKELKIVNIGLKPFYNDLREQNISAIHVDWRPVAGGDKKMASILQKLK
ncbi:MAG TPA: hypothetical protein VK071_12850 [Tissierellales bacterium]|nr:hypothetical protein [Tissierellales bacterium]